MSNELSPPNTLSPSSALTSSALEGVRALIARPEEQANLLAAQLQQQGASTYLLPTISIQATADSPSLRTQFLNLDQYHHIIVISAHAARFGMQWVDRYWPQLPIGTRWYALGSKTANILKDEHIQVITPQTGQNSEALLNLSELGNVTGEKILILRGVGGRECLKEQLEQRGASVDYAELYKRTMPTYSNETLRAALVDFSPNLLITLSGETLDNLVELSQNDNIGLKSEDALSTKAVLVPSERVAKQAKALGFQRVLLPGSLDETSLVECIAQSGF